MRAHTCHFHGHFPVTVLSGELPYTTTPQSLSLIL